MVLTLEKVPEGRSALSQKVEVEKDRAEWIPLIDDLLCRAEIDRLPTRISVHVFYHGKVELECSRCLKKFEYPIEGECYVILKNGSAQKNQYTAEDEECDFYFSEGADEIDIRSAIFDDILLSLPLKPLCFEACPGIALTLSGTFQSQGKKSNDPRWDKLKKISFKSPPTKS